MSDNLVITILAAGEGKRMNSTIPKVLHMFNNKPMLVRIIETVLLLKPNKIIIVTGKHYELIKSTVLKYLDITLIDFVIQKEPLGTGDAIKSCLSHYKENDRILILNGDMPLINKDVLDKFIKNNNVHINILVAKIENPTGYGRIIYNQYNEFIEIVEEKDCNELQRKINIINSGLYYVTNEILQDYIPLIKNTNKQNEYYLTDIVKLLKNDEKYRIDTFLIDEKDNRTILGVNTQQELFDLENEDQKL